MDSIRRGHSTWYSSVAPICYPPAGTKAAKMPALAELVRRKRCYYTMAALGFATTVVLVVLGVTGAFAQHDAPPKRSANKCPGYEASNVVQGDSYLTADLSLAAGDCSLYSRDITNLRLTVEYQTGKQPLASTKTTCFNLLTVLNCRLPSARLDRRCRAQRLPSPGVGCASTLHP